LVRTRTKHAGGRPPKPPEQRFTQTFHIRVTDAEADRIYRAAIRQGVSAAVFLRSVLRHVLEVRPEGQGGSASSTEMPQFP
jgi:hypothetical protein